MPDMLKISLCTTKRTINSVRNARASVAENCRRSVSAWRRRLLLVIDYFSKCVELARLEDNTSSPEVIMHLKSIMARHGIPQELVSDNGPQFISNRFTTFAKQWEFFHNTSSPKFPSRNGQVERAVQTVKSILRKAQESKKDVYLALLEYRNTPIDANIASPAELLFQRKLRTRLPCKQSLLKPPLQGDTHEKLHVRQERVKRYHDAHAKQFKAT